jgi:D-glycero-D-manno-heptose 1,7-bisphosphate phosphatase
VLLDRDGVVAVQIHHLHKKEQLEVIPRAAEAIRCLNEAGFVVVIVTNQAVVARGLSTEAEIDEIHDELRRKLAEEGATLDAVYYCPHHEEATLPQYRRVCPDRKPEPGLCFRAADEWNLDLSRSFMVGDRSVDIQCGKSAGCKTILVRTGYGGNDGLCDVEPDYVCDDLWAAIGVILGSKAENCNRA